MPTKSALVDFANLVKPHRSARNDHVHQGRLLSIAEVMDSDMLDRLELFSGTHRFGKPVLSEALLDSLYKDEIPKIAQRMTELRQDAESKVTALFDTLLPIYRHHITLMNNRDASSSTAKAM
jgi:hypothetical protein